MGGGWYNIDMPDCRIAHVCTGSLSPKNDCTATGGAWHCVTCHEGFANNMMASSHNDMHSTHQLGWVCFEHDTIETP